GNDEIDIIAEKDDLIIFAEVKTRSSNYMGEPEIFVTKKKQRFIIRAANAYLTRYEVEKEARLDVISIVLSADRQRINHIERAFYPTL
ncbi:MAG: YraN family protein, partial [Bacteroidales bacterium]